VTASELLASVDGEIMAAAEATIPAGDEGLLRGDGVFEVVRVYDGRPFALEEHLARLQRSGARSRLDVDAEAVRSDLFRLLAAAGAGPPHDLVRVVLTRGGRRLLMTEPLKSAVTGGRIRLGTVTYSPTRVLDGVKTLSYGANMLATRIAVEQGFDEALLVTPHGRVLEAPTSSIFWVRGGELFTPPLSDHILASITRAHVVALSGAVERACTLEELLAAEEAFLASTTREVQGVAAVDGRAFADHAPVTERAAAALRAAIEATLGP
jgi:branched-chain amino acid aminotransferase